MAFASRLLTVLTTLSAVARSAPAADLKPWQVTRLSTHSPSGRPGNPPFCYLRLNITDPNEFNLGKTHYGDAIIDPSSTQCNLQWDCLRDTIWEQVNPCSPTRAGLWTFEVLVPIGNSSRPSATADFDLRFTLVNKMVMNDDITMTQKFVGRQHFAVGKNMNGACGGSSVCNWGLIENTIVEVTQNRVDQASEDAGDPHGRKVVSWEPIYGTRQSKALD